MRRVFLIAFAAALYFYAGTVRAAPLIADLDRHLVAITTDFTGSELLLFGSIELEDDEAGDIVVVVFGPNEEVVVRRKDRVVGMWINQDSMTFSRVPAFYHVATTHPEGIALPDPVRARHQIGVENIRMRGPEDAAPEAVDAFKQALLRNKIRVGHFTRAEGVIERRGKLFRTSVSIPANVPVGTYTVETLLIKNGQIIGAQTTPLFVSKVGVGAQIYRFAHLEPLIFGIVAVFIATAAGLGANWIFRKI